MSDTWIVADRLVTGQGLVIWWNRLKAPDGQRSLPAAIESAAPRWRRVYIEWVSALGRSDVAGQSLAASLEFEPGASAWWLSRIAEKSPFSSPRIYDSLRLLQLSEWLAEGRPQLVRLCVNDSCLAEAVSQVCRELGVGFVWEGRPAQTPFRGRVPHELRGLAWLVRRWWRASRVRRRSQARWGDGAGAIAIISQLAHVGEVGPDGGVRTRLWGDLPGALCTWGARLNWLHVFVETAATPTLESAAARVRLRPGGSNVSTTHELLDQWLTVGVVLRVLRSGARVWWRQRRIPRGDARWRHARLEASLWPLHRNDWDASVRGSLLVEGLTYCELFKRVCRDLPKGMGGVYLMEGQPWERALLWAWRAARLGPIAGVMHSSVHPWHLMYEDGRPFGEAVTNGRPDRVLANGPVARRFLLDAGYPADAVVDVEAVRYLDTTRREARGPGGGLTRVLVVGDFVPEATATLLACVREARPRAGGELMWGFRPHPAQRQSIPDDCLGSNGVIEEDPLPVLFTRYDVVVASATTSAALDAVLAGLPVIVVQDGALLPMSPAVGRPGVTAVGDAEELLAALARRLERPEPADVFYLDPNLPRWKAVWQTWTTERAGHD